MSRVAKRPVALPQGVTATITPSQVTVKGAKGSLSVAVSNGVTVKEENKQLQVSYTDGDGVAALAGSTRAHLANVVQGVTAGFEKKLELVGVGYRAAVQGKVLTLTLGYSHAIVFDVPEGITIDVPSQTEIIVKGIDRQRVGQVAAELRAFRSPEPYKGKGVKYSDEKIALKEGKKK
ncbi:MAG: hypothetical protein RLZZ393_882 [Pseudomonadota bacterium]|jgi:large subunit ribosomal protein L6